MAMAVENPKASPWFHSPVLLHTLLCAHHLPLPAPDWLELHLEGSSGMGEDMYVAVFIIYKYICIYIYI